MLSTAKDPLRQNKQNLWPKATTDLGDDAPSLLSFYFMFYFWLKSGINLVLIALPVTWLSDSHLSVPYGFQKNNFSHHEADVLIEI